MPHIRIFSTYAILCVAAARLLSVLYVDLRILR